MNRLIITPLKLINCLIFCLLFHPSWAQKSIHELWDNELKKFVDAEGRVDYKRWKEDTILLDAYIAELENNPPKPFWRSNDSLGYFINAYNAITVKLILDHYPIKSIRKLVTPWRLKRFKLNNTFISLNHIEHKILRKMNDPRIHFAINCASRSCPKLQNSAFFSHKIDQQLEHATKAFINDSSKNKISKDNVQLSRIFQWFAKDFGNKKQRLNFIQSYTQECIDSHVKIRFLSYDWRLNDLDMTGL